MKKMICDKGHFYDGDKYDSCPTCRVYQEHQASAGVENVGAGEPVRITGHSKNKSRDKDRDKDRDKEQHSKKGWLAGLIRSGGHTMEMPSEDMEVPEQHSGETLVLPEENEEPMNNTLGAISQAEEAKGGTVALWQEAPRTPIDTSSGKTVAFYSMEDEPVTGFLICTMGESKGTSYTLKTGQNFIGRGMDMDVMLVKETSVSRVKHAVIIFDPKKREFYLQPGESSGLTYLNGDLVMSFCRLSAYDEIQLGECTLMFLPFCGERFSWD